MADSGWGFDVKAKRYRDLSSGKFLGKKSVVAIRDAVVAAATADARALAERAVRGEITTDEFRAGMRVALRNAHVAEYALGRGGVNAMTPSDFGKVGRALRDQYAYLNRFALEIEAGMLSEAQAAARASTYTGAGVTSFEQGQASAWGATTPILPGQDCYGMGNCRCSLSYKETETTIEITWNLGGTNPCPVCQQHAGDFSPYVTPKAYAVADRSPVRLAQLPRDVDGDGLPSVVRRLVRATG